MISTWRLEEVFTRHMVEDSIGVGMYAPNPHTVSSQSPVEHGGLSPTLDVLMGTDRPCDNVSSDSLQSNGQEKDITLSTALEARPEYSRRPSNLFSSRRRSHHVRSAPYPKPIGTTSSKPISRSSPSPGL